MFQRIRLLAEFLANFRRFRREGSARWMLVEIALAGDGSLAADIEHSQRAHLSGIWNPDNHPELLENGRIG
jgi:hypothetical protein